MHWNGSPAAARFVVGLLVATAMAAAPSRASAQTGADPHEWRFYGGDPGHTKYTPLDQITADNVDRLRIAWTWTSVDDKLRAENPVIRDGQRFRTYAYEGDAPGGRRRALRHHEPGAGRGDRADDRRDALELRPRPLPGRPPRRARLPDARARLLVRRRGIPAALRRRADVAGLRGREDRQAGSGVRPERPGRPDAGTRPHHRHEPVRGQLCAARGRRHGRGRLRHHGGPGPQGGAARTRARLRRPHRRDEVDLSHDSAGRRLRQRDLGKRIVEVVGGSQRLVEHERRPGARLHLPAGRLPGHRLLRRASPRRQPVCQLAGLPRRRNRRAGLALPVRPPCGVGTTTCRRRRT